MIGNLQVLRGISALLVALVHTGYGFNSDVQPVSTFFVISGFIMCFITEKDSSDFFRRRVIRIVPFYWFCTALLLIVVHRWAFFRFWNWSFDFATHLARSLMFVPSAEQPLLGVGWTLNIEMYFYAVFAIALLLHRRLAPIITAAVIIAVVALYTAGCTLTVCEAYGHHYTPYFVAGIALFYVWRPVGAMLPRWFAAAAGGAILILCYANQAKFAGDAIPVLVVGTALVMTAAGVDVTWWPALLIGDASYAIYLTHPAVQELYTKLGLAPIIGSPATDLGAMLAVLAACLVVGVGLHLAVEKPLYRWMLRKYRRNEQTAPASAARTAAE